MIVLDMNLKSVPVAFVAATAVSALVFSILAVVLSRASAHHGAFVGGCGVGWVRADTTGRTTRPSPMALRAGTPTDQPCWSRGASPKEKEIK